MEHFKRVMLIKSVLTCNPTILYVHGPLLECRVQIPRWHLSLPQILLSSTLLHLNGLMTMSFEPEPDLDPVLPDLAGSGLNHFQIRF